MCAFAVKKAFLKKLIFWYGIHRGIKILAGTQTDMIDIGMVIPETGMPTRMGSDWAACKKPQARLKLRARAFSYKHIFNEYI